MAQSPWLQVAATAFRSTNSSGGFGKFLVSLIGTLGIFYKKKMVGGSCCLDFYYLESICFDLILIFWNWVCLILPKKSTFDTISYDP